jgi:threonine dehydrogenase-like Zn-dependent dehydrogenase
MVGPEILQGDEGSYLIPVQKGTGYAQAALTEPWACVVASYDVEYRAGWKPEGTVLVAVGPEARDRYQLGTPYAGGQPPAEVITLGVAGTLLEELRERAEADGFELVELSAPSNRSLEQVKQETGKEGFDDLVLLGADQRLYEMLQPAAEKGCVINIVGGQGFSAPTQVDVGRLHYDNLSLTGTDQPLIAAAYEPIRTQLHPGGDALFIGAAGPMGQMHVQRALQLAEGPELAVATDLVPERLAVIEEKFAQLIEAKSGRTDLVLHTPEEGQSPQDFNAELLEMTGGKGYDDIVVLAPSPRVVEGAARMLAPDGVLNVFAGLTRGTKASIDLARVATEGVRFTGTSGSAIRDLRNMLYAAESDQLNPNLSVAAISGMTDVKKGLEGLMHQAYPGKVVIYPQVLDFPLTRLSELEDVLPQVYEKLGPNETWTVEAEAEFLKEQLP